MRLNVEGLEEKHGDAPVLFCVFARLDRRKKKRLTWLTNKDMLMPDFTICFGAVWCMKVRFFDGSIGCKRP